MRGSVLVGNDFDSILILVVSSKFGPAFEMRPSVSPLLCFRAKFMHFVFFFFLIRAFFLFISGFCILLFNVLNLKLVFRGKSISAFNFFATCSYIKHIII